VHASTSAPGATILQRGFRPFFLLAAAYGCVYVPVWLAVLAGIGPAPGWNDPITWHAHEMLFGMVAAAALADHVPPPAGKGRQQQQEPDQQQPGNLIVHENDPADRKAQRR